MEQPMTLEELNNIPYLDGTNENKPKLSQKEDINWDEIIASNKIAKESEHIKNVLLNALKTQASLEKVKVKEEKKKYEQTLGVMKIDNYMDNAKRYYEYQPYFYDKSNVFWLWNSNLHKYEYTDDVDIMRIFDTALGFQGQTVNSKIKANTLEAMKRYGREKQPLPSKKKWIQFKDKAYSIFSGHIHEVTPDYFFTNPIPWELGETSDTPTMDKLFIDWVGEENKDLLYEIIAYGCYTDYPIHKIICLIGSGANGKTKFTNLFQKFLGSDNISSSELDLLLNSRFESFKLYKKLACIMGETNFGTLTKTSTLKNLSGQSPIGFEMKGKQPFTDVSYAKIIICSNSLPISDDTTDGFYRRWFIVNFPNQFDNGKDILESIPEVEYNNLARKVTEILPKLLERGQFIKQGDIKESKEKYIMASNPISTFLKTYCEKDVNEYCSYGKLHTLYNLYLNACKKRRVKSKEFKQCLEDEGLWVEKTSKKLEVGYLSGLWIEGLKIKEQFANYDNCAVFPIQLSRDREGVENNAQLE